ncbi:MAG: sigma-E factor negative regulatory protein [Planctomycetes bacterium]|nr:sigma-E factor negative regulatory protein [Planctomycetota bacterium]
MKHDMSKEVREHLSCLMDGEISRETSRFLVRRLDADEELCATWARYHLVRDCLRHHEGGLASSDLCKRVSQALESEAPQTPVRRLPMAWLKPVAGVAVAASVALMAIVMVGPANDIAGSADDGLAGVPKAPSFTSPQGFGPTPPTHEASYSGPSMGGPRMNSYLLRHYQATGSTGGRGFVSFVPIVVTKQAADPEEPEALDPEILTEAGEASQQR